SKFSSHNLLNKIFTNLSYLLLFILSFIVADTLVPVITVLPGEPAALNCVIPDHKLDSNEIHWYKQRAGDSLKIVVTQRRHANSTYGSDYSASRMQSNKEERISTLSILQTVHEDEGMYYCAIINWAENVWQATYLSVKATTLNNLTCFWVCFQLPKHVGSLNCIFNSFILISVGHNNRTMNYTVTPKLSVSGPSRDAVNLECSVLSDTENRMCSGNLSVFSFRAT
uniref:Ig-like domain-containing protein n=1 Tax=Nothobranchius furzeri TaxID=105023 RepID=A0A8C6KHX4_NOTFU